MNVNEWEKCLQFGEKWEHKVSNKIVRFFQSIQARHISYADCAKMQRNGVDELITNHTISVDVKVRTKRCNQYYNKDITIEEKTKMDQPDSTDGIPGWYYKIRNKFLDEQNSEKTYPVLAYCWETKQGKNLERIGYLIPFNKEFFEWYEETKHLFMTKPAFTKTKIGTTWWTKNRIIPISSFPNQFLIKFNPKIVLNQYQQKLGSDN